MLNGDLLYQINSIFHVILGIIIFQIAIYNFWDSQHESFCRPRAYLSFLLAIWFLGHGFSQFDWLDSYRPVLVKITHSAVVFIPTFFLYFSSIILTKYHLIKKIHLAVSSVLSLSFFIILLLPQVDLVRGFSSYTFGINPDYSWIGFSFFIFYFVITLSAFICVWQAFKLEKDSLLKKRLLFILLAYAAAILSNMNFLPAFNIPVFPLGFIWLFIFLILSLYSVYLYHISSIQDIYLEFLSQTLSVLLAFFVWMFLMIIWTDQKNFVSLSNGFITMLALVPALVILYFFPKKIAVFLQHHRLSVKSLFFNTIVELKYPFKCAEDIVEAAKKITASQNVKFVLFDQSENKYDLVDYDYTVTTLDPDTQLKIKSLHEISHILNWDHAIQSHLTNNNLDDIISLFEYFNCQLLIPLINHDQVFCVVFIGRLDRLMYVKPTTLEMLNQLMTYATIAMNNAFYYDLVRQLSIDLWKANTRLNNEITKSTTALESAFLKMQSLYDEHSNFFTMALHNIRTPLTSITAASTILWRTYQSKDQESIYRILNNNIKRLNTLALDIVEIAKLDNANQAYNNLKIEIHDLIIKLFEELSEKFASKKIEWHYFHSDKIAAIHAEADKIKMVLDNLLTNAFQFSHPHGQVVATLQPMDKDNLKKYGLDTFVNPDNFCEFAIADTGPGIPLEHQEHLFDNFIHGLQNKTFSGSSGLGLYMVKKIVESYGGAVTFKSEPNQGSTFYFILPI